MTTPLGSPFTMTGSSTWKNLLIKAKAHQEALAVTGIIVIILALFVPYYLHSRAQSEKDATGVLGLGQWYLSKNVDSQPGSFKTTAEKYTQCLQTFQRINTDYPGTSAAKLAKYYTAKCQYMMGQYSQAYSGFEEASSQLKGTPLADEAQLGKILSLVGENEWNQAQLMAAGFLTDHPNSFLAPEVKLDLSDIYLQLKDKDKAVAELKEVVTESPASAWGQEAARRLQDSQS